MTEDVTEAVWLAATDPRDLLFRPGWRRRLTGEYQVARRRAFEPCPAAVADRRKLRLYACATMRRTFPRLTFAADRHVLDLAERFADGAAAGEDLLAAGLRCGLTLAVVAQPSAVEAARGLVTAGRERPDHPAGPQTPLSNADRCHLLRDLFGNPFRPVAFDPAWRTSTAVALARAIYDERAFDNLPILADALQDAGCEDADLLAHCRGDGPHARGCWVVDLVLGTP